MKYTKNILRLVCLLMLSCALLVGCAKETHTPYKGSGGGAAPAYKDEGDSETKPNTNYTKRVAITFDDGPHDTYTREIVDELAKYGYHATFFVVGNRVDGSEYNGAAAMKYAHSKGNEIAIHAYTHDAYYDDCSDKVYGEELSKTEAAIKAQIPNANIKLMRPVGGRISDERVSACKYSVIMWSIDSEDWKHSKDDDVSVVVEGIMDGVENGDIILMHDIYGNTVEAAREVLKQLNEKGFEVVSVSELLGSGMKAGQKYFYKSKNQ